MKGKAILSIIISIILSISFFENDISSVRVLAASNPYPATQDVDGMVIMKFHVQGLHGNRFMTT